MPIDPSRVSSLAGGVWTVYSTAIPTATSALRENSLATPPVLPHNPMLEMVTACCGAWVDVLNTLTAKDNYVGTAGAASSPPTKFAFSAAEAAGAALAASMVWAGAAAVPVARALTTDIANQLIAQVQIQMPPPVGGGTGTGAISPGSNPDYTALQPAFLSALMARFTSTGNFFIGDSPALGLTKEILFLLNNLAANYVTILASIAAPTVYTGSASSTAVTLVNAGVYV